MCFKGNFLLLLFKSSPLVLSPHAITPVFFFGGPVTILAQGYFARIENIKICYSLGISNSEKKSDYYSYFFLIPAETKMLEVVLFSLTLASQLQRPLLECIKQSSFISFQRNHWESVQTFRW